jgi:hypothetical protein
MGRGREETDDRRWRFGLKVGEGLWEWFGRGSFGISKDMYWGASDDGVKKVVELRYAREEVCAALHCQL